MAADQDDEESLLRSVALQNAKSILAARQRAERELVESKDALERKTQELAAANRRLVLLNRVANSLILDEAPQRQLAAAFDTVAEVIGAQYHFYYRYDRKDPAHLTLVASGGLSEEQKRVLSRIGLDAPVLGEAARSRQPFAAGEVNLRDDEATAVLRSMGVKAYIGLPLLAHDHLFGAIAFGSTRQVSFTEADLELLQTLADQFAATLDRARLLETLRESETRYRLALSAGRMGTWETDFVAGTRTWSEEGMALFGLELENGIGHIGGVTDEFRAALHPDDRHLVAEFHQLANKEDSFSAEYRIVQPGGKVIWVTGRGVASRGADGKALRLINIVTEITERKAAEDHIQLLMREISHRSKNLLSVVQAIAGQTARTAETLGEFEMRFGRRLRGLAASHDRLVHEDWRGATLADLVRDHLTPFVDVRGPRLEIVGPEVVVTSEAAQAIGLALHELATNAIKYGALSGEAGKVKISWAFTNERDAPCTLLLSWVERDGPPVTPPARKGFGHIVVEDMVALSLNGSVDMEFAPQGLRWTLSIPASNLVGEAQATAGRAGPG